MGRLLIGAWRQQTGGDAAGVYDEVLREVSARAAAEESLGKADIGALVLWKRITAQATWATQLLLLPDSQVRAVTGAAFAHANNLTLDTPGAGQAARSALWGLPGMGGTGALASAVLLSLAPARMAVWDRRVSTSLAALDRRPKPASGFYGRYLTTLLALAGEMDQASTGGPHIPRDVDLALFYLAGSETRLAEARSAGQRDRRSVMARVASRHSTWS